MKSICSVSPNTKPHRIHFSDVPGRAGNHVGAEGEAAGLRCMHSRPWQTLDHKPCLTRVDKAGADGVAGDATRGVLARNCFGQGNEACRAMQAG